MNILLHGAINGSNFGDCIFADVFFNRLKQEFPDDNFFFYDAPKFGIGKFLREKLDYKKKLSLFDYLKMDKLIYISGGYFGEDIKSIKLSIVRLIRYLLIGAFMAIRKRDIYVVGLEVGPLHYSFVKKCIGYILKKSTLVIVRNVESQEYCERLGVNDSICTADTALLLTESDFMRKNKFSKVYGGIGKNIFIHVNPREKINNELKEKILEPVADFILKHRDYNVIFGCDGKAKDVDYESLIAFYKDRKIEACYFDYNDYWEMCSLLSEMEIIITRKLHVGIIGSLLNKSVISLPTHPYKTQRFYEQIGEEKRCIPYGEITYRGMCNQIEKYCQVSIKIPSDIIDKANANLLMLVETLKNNN